MSNFIIERYIYDVFNAKASLSAAPSKGVGQGTPPHHLAHQIIKDIELYFADHMDDVLVARDRLASRTDPEGRDMFAYIEKLLASHEDADRIARAAIEKASRS